MVKPGTTFHLATLGDAGFRKGDLIRMNDGALYEVISGSEFSYTIKKLGWWRERWLRFKALLNKINDWGKDCLSRFS